MSARPVLLTVDDDPQVSRAVARDLRRQYGEDYRVLRAESGPAALELLGELRGRPDERAALLLADHRMPGMTGVEFLEQAMDLFPAAKRVLLTAYADTDAAIRAINYVDLDRYLLKPWDPPEERLYPVLDDLLADWSRSSRPPFEGVRIVGHRFSARSHEVRDFLARRGVPYAWVDLAGDREEAGALLQAAGLTGAPADLPLVVLPDGTPVRAPDNDELARQLGLPTRVEAPFYDVVVVGAGPAGLGAAVYGASEGLSTLLVDSDATGGQAGQSSRIENYLGFPAGVSGFDLAARATAQARRFGAEIVSVRGVTELDTDGPARRLHLDDGTVVGAHAVVLATGVSYTRLAAVDEFTGRGVYYGAAATEGSSCVDQRVYVVGGANSAGQAALYFARYAERVTMLVRSSNLAKGMSAYLVEQVEAHPRVDVLLGTEVVAAQGEDRLTGLTLCTTGPGSRGTRDVPADFLFVFIGARPRTDWLAGVVERDERGFVRTGPDLRVDGALPAAWPLEREPYYLESSLPGVFVAGDVRASSVKRVASAVGEGAMAVTLVHRYLEKS